MPLVLVPLIQYFLIPILVLFTSSGAIAGLMVRFAPPAHRAKAAWMSAAGIAIALTAATVQSAVVLRQGLVDSEMAAIYFSLIVAWTVLAGLIGLVVLVLLARTQRAVVTVTAAVAALPVGTWVIWLLPATASPASLVLLWVMPAALLAVTYLSGFRAEERMLDRVTASVDVLVDGLAPAVSGPPVLIALGVGLLGTLALLLFERYQYHRMVRGDAHARR